MKKFISLVRLIKGCLQKVIHILRTLIAIVYKGTIKLWNSILVRKDVVLIVGNGPSLSNNYLAEAKSKGVELCCVNSFANENSMFFDLKPKYYCAIDQDIYADKPLYPEENRELFKYLEKVDWPMIYICKKGQRLPFDNENISYVFLPDVTHDEMAGSQFFYKHSLATYPLINVIGACLYFCITSRMERVFLIGVENDWHKELLVGEDNIVYRKKEHFYGQYLENVTKTGIIGTGELYKYFEYYALTLKSYYIAAKYAKNMNVSVYNLTLESYIDSFEKKKEIW